MGRDNNAPTVYGNTLSYLQCYSYTYFVITWDDIAITVFVRQDVNWPWHVFLTGTTSSYLWPIINIGICTMYGSTGQWHFYTSDIPTTSDETTALLESTTANITRPPQITTANYMSTITDGKWTRPLTYTSTDLLAMYDETTELPQTTRPDNMTTTSTTMTLKFMTTPSSMSISETKPCAGKCNSTCTCNCLDVPKKASNNVLVNQLKIDKKTLSSYKRRLQSATDPRKSSLYIGCVGIVVFSVNVAFIVLLDFLPGA
ncbi:unnamed protein product [Mytilus coruscus]|uniref:Uncharacterized protein n=1 Tax=Mytilus coruscus TaxID=42192 RepID=A0A6J8BLL6_MYTCO|nr:unnamed protein product [Mytilus coruscus]